MSRDALVDFDALPRSTRERLAGCMRRNTALFSHRYHGTSNAVVWWLLAGVLGLGGFILLVTVGFGVPGARVV